MEKFAPPISVTDAGVIVEGNHRYVASLLFGKTPATKLGTEAIFMKKMPAIVKWSTQLGQHIFKIKFINDVNEGVQGGDS